VKRIYDPRCFLTLHLVGKRHDLFHGLYSSTDPPGRWPGGSLRKPADDFPMKKPTFVQMAIELLSLDVVYSTKYWLKSNGNAHKSFY
jgi:hypothetical protein